MKLGKFLASLVIILLILIYILPVTSLAATSNNGLASDEILKFRNYTIKKTTTIAQLNSQFGTPKAEGESAFGGKSYSYCDNNYTWYLHIETNAKGEIKGFGCIEGNFVSKRYKYGDNEENWYSFLSGRAITEDDSNKVVGIYEYNCTSTEEDEYWNRYLADGKYLYDLQKHTIIVSKILAKKHNDDFPQTYIDENLFYINEQLKANGTDLYDYGIATGKQKYISLITAGIRDYYFELPNPLGLGYVTENYNRAENYKYLFYDIKLTSSNPNKFWSTIVFIDPSFLEEKQEVELTAKEKELLTKVKEISAQEKKNIEAANEFASNNGGSQYIIEPQCDNLPLTAGKWNDMALQGSTDYINMARVGMGLTPLKLNEDIVECAQNKAALVMYNSNHDLLSGHYPEQPSGVSDDFYDKAQSYMNENLYMGNVQSSITNALNDGYGDPEGCGHRYNLLEPSHTEWGVGSVSSEISYGTQGVHKFSSSGSYNSVELVAWPSNGIFPLDMAYNGIGNWTAKFYKNYKVSDKTEVTIKCLNTGKTYEITNANKNNSGKFLKAVNSGLLSFRDDSIAYESGDVFEITLHNVTNSTGKTTDYTYRSVFMSAFQLDEKEVTNIKVDTTSVELGVGASKKVNAIAEPTDATNKLMEFTSSNEKVAKVRQDGLITATGVGSTTITITCGDITKKVQVTVNPFIDVKKSDWYYVAVDYTYKKGIISGATATEFRPSAKITRGMIVTILWRMEGSPKVTGVKDFTDVKGQYYYDAVRWAAKYGVVNGYGDGRFGPNANITREQLATILCNYTKYKKKYTNATIDTSKYKDWYKVSSYAKPSIQWAIKTGVIEGKENGTKVDPLGTATRGEAACMIYNYCTKIK